MSKQPMTDDELVARAIEVVRLLEGSSRSLEEVATEEELNSQVFCQALDARLMLCDECGWWAPTHEMTITNFIECEQCTREKGNAEETDD